MNVSIRKLKQNLHFVNPIDIGYNKGQIRKSIEIQNYYLTITKKCLIKLHQNNFKSDAEKKACKNELISAKKHITLTEDMLKAHIKHQSLLYYTNLPNTNEILIDLDFDKQKHSRGYFGTALKNLTNYMQYHIPQCFYDNGSSGHSLNYYVYMDISQLHDTFLNTIQSDINSFFDDTYQPISFASFVNDKLSELSDKLKYIFNTIKILGLDSNYYHFDSIKATVANIQYTNKNGKIYYDKVLGCGTFGKLPCPTYDTFDLFLNKKLYSFSEFESLVHNLHSEAILLDNSINAPSSALNAQTDNPTSPTSSAHSVLSPSQEKNSVTSIENENKKNINYYNGNKVDNDSCSSISSNTIYMAGSFPDTFISDSKIKVEEKSEKEENDYNICSIKNETQPIARSMKALKYLIYKYQSDNKELSLENYRTDYRLNFGTDEEDKNDAKRLTYIYTKYYELFKEQLGNFIAYKINLMIDVLKQQITEEEINQIRIQKTKSQSKITYEDIAGAALSFYSLLIDSTYRECKEWCEKDETVPTSAVKSFLNKLHDKKMIARTCDDKKIKAIRIVLEQIQWIRIVNPNFSFHKHIAMRYLLGKKHPYYNQFINIFGQDIEDKYTDTPIEIPHKEVG